MHHESAIVLVPDNPALSAELAPAPVVPLSQLNGNAAGACIFIDLLLDEGSGLELCRRLRGDPATAASRIVIVLDEDDIELRRRALRAGADDYAIGPLTVAQVLERAGFRPAGGARPAASAHGPIYLDRQAHQVRVRGTPVAMGPNEFKVLSYFLDNRDRVISRAELIRAVRTDAIPVDERTVDVWIGRLRRSFESCAECLPIRTVRQMGYVLDS